MECVTQIGTNMLRAWLEAGKDISILEVRPIRQKTEWLITSGIYFGALGLRKAVNTDATPWLHPGKTVPAAPVCAGDASSMITATSDFSDINPVDSEAGANGCAVS